MKKISPRLKVLNVTDINAISIKAERERIRERESCTNGIRLYFGRSWMCIPFLQERLGCASSCTCVRVEHTLLFFLRWLLWLHSISLIVFLRLSFAPFQPAFVKVSNEVPRNICGKSRKKSQCRRRPHPGGNNTPIAQSEWHKKKFMEDRPSRQVHMIIFEN